MKCCGFWGEEEAAGVVRGAQAVSWTQLQGGSLQQGWLAQLLSSCCHVFCAPDGNQNETLSHHNLAKSVSKLQASVIHF